MGLCIVCNVNGGWHRPLWSQKAIVVSVYFWHCFIYWADNSLLSYICIFICQSQRSVTGRILAVYTSHDLINTVWRLHVILDRGRRFWTCSKLSTPLISCFLLARSLPINKNQRATVLHLIFAFLSCLIVKVPKSF